MVLDELVYINFKIHKIIPKFKYFNISKLSIDILQINTYIIFKGVMR